MGVAGVVRSHSSSRRASVAAFFSKRVSSRSRSISVPVFLLALVLVLVIVQVAVVVPVVLTQKAKDDALVGVQLQAWTDAYAASVNKTVSSFMYNVVRAAAAAPISGFLSEQAMADAIQPDKDPINTPITQYFWVPNVPAEERAAFEAFYGFSITELLNGSRPVVRVPESDNRTLFIPFAAFVPSYPDPVYYGFDLLPYNATTTPTLFENAPEYLSIPSALVSSSRTSNNYGFVAVAQNKYGRGYMFGRIGSKELLEFSLSVPRDVVRLAAYVTRAKSDRQALYFDNVPELMNATTLAIFNASPDRQHYYTANFTTYDENILVAIRFSDDFASRFAGTTWVILAAVLGPVCFLIDVIVVIVAALWDRRKRLLLFERRKRQEAQVMINYVNHEIRNPLQTILGLADLQLERAEGERDALLASDLGTIVQSAEFIEHIARDILDLRRVEEGKLEVTLSEVDLVQCVGGLEKAVGSMQHKRPNVAFKVNVEKEIQSIRTDRYRLEQILLNFLTNAFKHTEEGVVTMSASCLGLSWIRFAVWDTGKGIAPEKKELLFKQFSQVSSEDASDFGGFGLGLYLTKMLAKLLGGTVGFESTLGLGSVFWVDLPVEWENAGLALQFASTEVPVERVVGLTYI
jgi:signal transduction histidine kinase